MADLGGVFQMTRIVTSASLIEPCVAYTNSKTISDLFYTKNHLFS